uniref:galactokinase n=1 Tax=Ningiella ruwaisensis TaxID=2364274 RepID=UPI00109F79F2|nr:galactokinase [Ningiella ruwaisensis]
MLNKVKSEFTSIFNEAPLITRFAPGRVNIIGDHTDYNGGYVFPTTLNIGTYIAGSSRKDKLVNVLALNFNQQIRFELNDIQHDTLHPWSNYIRGVYKVLLNKGYQLSGANLVIGGNLPQGAGLSSSASLELALLKLLDDLHHLLLDGTEAAKIGQATENEFVGCQCGIMDQMISAKGRANSGMLLHCDTLQYEYIAIPKNAQLLVINSNIQRGLVDSEYNLRREQCEQAAQICKVGHLSELNIDTLEEFESALGALLFKRAKHVVSENLRVLELAEAIPELDWTKISNVMRHSHASLRDDFAVSTRNMDILVDIIDTALAGQGGVRMTGGGFGGCAVVLCEPNRKNAVINAVLTEYLKLTGLQAEVYECKSVDGAFYTNDSSSANIANVVASKVVSN